MHRKETCLVTEMVLRCDEIGCAGCRGCGRDCTQVTVQGCCWLRGGVAGEG